MEGHEARPFTTNKLPIYLLAIALLIAFLAGAFRLGVVIWTHVFAGDDLWFFRHYFDTSGKTQFIGLLAAVFLAAGLLNAVADFYILKRRPGPWFVLPFAPFILIIVISNFQVAVYGALMVCFAMFILLKFDQAFPLVSNPSKDPIRKLKKGALFFYIAGALWIAAWITAYWSPEVTPLVLIVFFIYLVCTRWNLKSLIKTEGLIFLLVILCGTGIEKLGAVFDFYIWFDNGLFALCFVLFHLPLFFQNRKSMRLPGIAMLLLLFLGFSASENFLKPFHLDEKKRSLDKIAYIDPERKGNFLGQPIPFGAFNADAAGWFVEVGHFRMGKPDREKSPGTYRIIVQGSSTTEGAGVEKDEDVWSSFLEQDINQAGLPYKVEVINAGIGGTTTFGMLKNFEQELIHYNPNMLILYIGHNDQSYFRGPFTEKEMFLFVKQGQIKNVVNATGILETGDEGAVDAKRITLKTQIFLSQFSLYRLLRRQILDVRSVNRVFYDAALSRKSSVPPEDFISNLEIFNALCKKNGITFLIFGEACRCDLSQYKKLMDQTAKNSGVFYLDANQKIGDCNLKDEELFTDFLHLTPKGNECIAGIISGALFRNHLLPEQLQ